MKQNKGTLYDAFSSLRGGKFERAFELADSVIRKDINNFWAWYVAAVALGFLQRSRTFEHYVERASSLSKDSAYILYLQAFISLTRKDLESALVHWTRLVDLEEGWLARELIEKARKGVNLLEKAEKGNISYFIVIPDFSKGMEHIDGENEPGDEIHKNEKIIRNNSGKKMSFAFSLLRNLIFLIALAGLAFLARKPVLKFLTRDQESQSSMWKNFKIDDWAALIDRQESGKNHYKYGSKDQLIEDFENAKARLSENKINQSRFLLQRILYSNADFKTKEKSKIFLSFIPEPDYQDFLDPVFPEKLLETPAYYTDCLVLWQGNVIKIRDVDKGKELRLLIKDDTSDYIVDAFLPGRQNKSNWLPFSDYREKKEIMEKKSQAIVYGKFKGIIGKQKVIYLELIQLWM